MVPAGFPAFNSEIQSNRPVIYKYAHLLQACTKSTDLKHGMHLHGCCSEEIDINSSLYLANTLLYMYAKCACVPDARHVFDRMAERNLFSWTTIISAYVDHGPAEEAITLYQCLCKSGLALDKYSVISALKACVLVRCVRSGMHVHAHAIIDGFDSILFVANTLIDMYAKCFCIDDACRVFHQLPTPDIISWNAILTGFLYLGLDEEVLVYYIQMQQIGLQPNNVTSMLALKACSGCASVVIGKQIHVHVFESCSDPDVWLLNTLVDMYGKVGDLDIALIVFNKMYKRDVSTWNVIIAANVEEGLVLEAFSLFALMKEEGYQPDEITFSTILKSCASLTTIEHGRYVHSELLKSGFKLDAVASSVLMDMYMKNGSCSDAWRMFEQSSQRDGVVWNVIIAGCTQNGLSDQCLELFKRLLVEGSLPDKTTFLSMLKVCLGLVDLHYGKTVHVLVMERGLWCDISISNSILEMYVKCGTFEDAAQGLANTQVRDTVSWNTLIIACNQQGLQDNTLSLFEQMLQEQVIPDHFTFSSVLKVCAGFSALEWGMEIHKLVLTNACESYVSVGNALVDIYAKCGTIADAVQVFQSMEDRQVVTWTAIIAGCALQGLSREALVLFQKMHDEGVRPDMVAFVAVLSACSRDGLLEEGCYYFRLMSGTCCIAASAEHVACMVDLLARAGHLQAAKLLILDMPIGADAVVWLALLDACRSHGDVDLGRDAFICLVSLEPHCSQAYVLLSNIFAQAGMWDEVSKMREEMKNVICKDDF